MGRLAAGAAVGLIGAALVGGFGHGLGGLLLGAGMIILLLVLRGRVAVATPSRALAGVARRARRVVTPSGPALPQPPSDHSSLDGGVREIRHTDPGFDPARFAGYAGMMFRDAQGAWTTGDIGSVRDRVTPEMHGELQAQCDRLRSARRTNRIEQIEITACITEAWQERGRDYVTAHIRGSLIDYTVDKMSDTLVEGSRTIPRDVDEFWTFTRPGGLNFWMLSAIQTS